MIQVAKQSKSGRFKGEVSPESRQPPVVQARREIKSGFPGSDLEKLAHSLSQYPADLAELIGMSKRTYARRKNLGQNLTPEESDRLYRLRQMAEAAFALFEGDREKAVRWLKTPLPILEDETPLQYCDTEPGAQFVRNLIGRLEHGVFT